MLFALASPGQSTAGICDLSQDLVPVQGRDKIASDFFDDYHITRAAGVYRIQARKRVQVDYQSLIRIMGQYKQYPKFMPGYKHVDVRRSAAGELYIGIRYRADFAFFTSRFTTAVEVIDGGAEYWQCWYGLDEHDQRIVEEYARAPPVNRGFWRFVDYHDGTTDIEYYSAIQPPLNIPKWLYNMIAGSSYQEVFEAIVERARNGLD